MTKDWLSHFKPATVPLTSIACLYCVVVFVALNLAGSDLSLESAAQWGHYPDRVIWEGKPWALITSVFVHLKIVHIAFNLYMLWMLGSCFEEHLGSRRWLLFFVGAAWVSSSAELLLSGSNGIGISGVVYALFGFAWLTRPRLPPFAELMDDHTVKTFLAWLVVCIVLTQLNVMQIANWAHAFGLAFGASVGALFVLRRRPAGFGLISLLLLSFVPLIWCPLSADWTSRQASQAHERGEYGTAIHWYRRSLALGQDSTWVWANLAMIYRFQEKTTEYKNALEELRKVDAEAAQKVESGYGTP
jgi:GlpG protein